MPLLQTNLEPESTEVFAYLVNQVDLINNRANVFKFENQEALDYYLANNETDAPFRKHEVIDLNIPNLQDLAAEQIVDLKQIVEDYIVEPAVVQNNIELRTIEPMPIEKLENLPAEELLP